MSKNSMWGKQPISGRAMRILVLRPGALGDVLLTLPALQALQAAFPGAAIEVMGNLSVLQMLPGRSVVHAVSSFDRLDLAQLFQPQAEPGAPLRGYLGSFDLILSYATPPEHVLARNLARLACGRVLTWDARPCPDRRVHMSDYLQEPLSELGVPPYRGYPSLRLTPADQEEGQRWWQEHGLSDADLVAIHPGSGSPAKNWPVERFRSVAQYLQRKGGARILLLSGPADESVLAEMRRLMRGQDVLVLQNAPLPLLAAAVARCRAYVGNDSGITHLAAAVGTPTVAIFGPTDAEVWAPRGLAVRVVQSPRAPLDRGPDAESRHSLGERVPDSVPSAWEVLRTCQPCGYLDAVPVAEVLEQLTSVLGRPSQTTSDTASERGA